METPVKKMKDSFLFYFQEINQLPSSARLHVISRKNCIKIEDIPKSENKLNFNEINYFKHELLLEI